MQKHSCNKYFGGFCCVCKGSVMFQSLIQILRAMRGSQALKACVAAAAGAGSQPAGIAAPPSIPNISPQRCTVRTRGPGPRSINVHGCLENQLLLEEGRALAGVCCSPAPQPQRCPAPSTAKPRSGGWRAAFWVLLAGAGLTDGRNRPCECWHPTREAICAYIHACVIYTHMHIYV